MPEVCVWEEVLGRGGALRTLSLHVSPGHWLALSTYHSGASALPIPQAAELRSRVSLDPRPHTAPPSLNCGIDFRDMTSATP
ncbi:hypothetical protein E2C01_068353 [Portunus trituberculatus]|uniref:Uncharacterized protein n=1 Tax=Portunus trituberculatus TaxID=210409 RepID=A0A5B7HW86_PORTR|nr:hypothetical protein [Portunus trituberculatus]